MSLLAELKRRNVFRVTAAYVVIGWLLLQVGDVVFEALELEASANRLLLALVVLGLIPTILFAWAFEMTPDGIKRDKDVVADESQDREKAKKLDYVTMVVLVIVGAMSLWQHWSDEPKEVETSSQAQVETIDTKPQQAFIQNPGKSLAVLPFINMANTSDNQPFTVGIHDDLITQLSKISALKVISRTSVLPYKDSGRSISDIASELNVSHVLEGGVQRAGSQVRLNVKLIEASTENQLWAQVFDRELTTQNIFQIQTEIAEQIAQNLRVKLTDQELQTINKKQTENIDAYNAYLAGRQRMLTRNSTALEEALALFEKASQLDPQYALAYVGQADVLNLLNDYSDLSRDEMFLRGEPLIEKALAIDPLLAEAHTSLANYLHEKMQLKEAQEEFEYAIKLNPSYATAYHWYGNLADRLGDQKKSLELYRKAAEWDPLSPVIQSNIGYKLIGNQQFTEAMKQFDRIIELVPDYSGGPNGKATVYAAQSNYVEALKWQMKAVDMDPGNYARQTEIIALLLNLDMPEEAQNIADQIATKVPDLEDLLHAQAAIDMYQSNYEKAAERYEARIQTPADNLKYRDDWALYKMMSGHYDEAINALLELYPGDTQTGFEINAENFDSTVQLIWMWQQQEKVSLAQSLLAQLESYFEQNPEQMNMYRRAMIHAVKGDAIAAAVLFEQQFKSGDTRGFWQGGHLPMLNEVMELPRTQEFLKLHHERIQQQKTEAQLWLQQKTPIST
ncbi:MAG: tetratricopeptide repeat protein [Xanthomonadales bacterium]|nr:tetratricopeptide repeat protein [Xanthomonadales bacterium]